MADLFVCALQEASAGTSFWDRICWWKHRGTWSSMTAFRRSGVVSLWEALEVKPARIRLRRRGATGNRARLSRLASALAELDGVEACTVSRWSRQITIDVCRDGPLSDRFLDTVEQATACVNATGLLNPERPVNELGADANMLGVVRAKGGKRALYLALAGGALSVSLATLVLPANPVVPFLVVLG
jgi:hypothetical protein